MASNLLNKYVWLAETIHKAKRITFEEINEKWLSNELSEGLELPIRTFHKWRVAIEDMFGLVIECERKGGYHYYIENGEELQNGSLRNWLLNTISVSNLLSNNQLLKDRILIGNVPSGREYLADILQAMKNGTKLLMTYKSFQRSGPSTFETEPWCVKLFEQRWYMLAKSEGYEEPRIYSLDRIKGIQQTSNKFSIPDHFDAETYFSDYYGIITGDDDFDVEPVALQVEEWQSYYLRTLPLHHTQMEVERNDKYSIFEYKLCPTFDFRQKILSLGESVSVLAPEKMALLIREQGNAIVRNNIMPELNNYNFKIYKCYDD